MRNYCVYITGLLQLFKKGTELCYTQSRMLFIVCEISFNTDMEEDGGMSHEHQLAFS